MIGGRSEEVGKETVYLKCSALYESSTAAKATVVQAAAACLSVYQSVSAVAHSSL